MGAGSEWSLWKAWIEDLIENPLLSDVSEDSKGMYDPGLNNTSQVASLSSKPRNMAEAVTPELIALVQDATLKAFWRKNALRQFLRGCGVQEAFLTSLSSDETKRDFLYRLIDALQKSKTGAHGIRTIAVLLSEQTCFPDLDGWEDAVEKRKSAQIAVSQLRKWLAKEKAAVIDEREAKKARTRFEELRQQQTRSQADLGKLNDRLTDLATRLGSQQAGYDFQVWFYDLVGFFEIECRRPYVVMGRQIDGSVTLDGTTYLVELKFTKEQADAPDIDSFYKKVINKADNTMGLMVSISGYSSVAINEASCDRTPLLLLDHNHVYSMLTGAYTLPAIIRRVRRDASQTGNAFLRIEDF